MRLLIWINPLLFDYLLKVMNLFVRNPEEDMMLISITEDIM